MTVTLKLPSDIERTFKGEAQARGLSLDEFLNQIILAHAGHVEESRADACPSHLTEEEGVPVLRTGIPIAVSVVDETLDSIRRERERSILGLSS